MSSTRRNGITTAAVMTIIFALVRGLLFELSQALNLTICIKRYLKTRQCPCNPKSWINWDYFKTLSNYLEVPMYTLSIVFVSVFNNDCLCPSRGQWQAGIIAVFLAWIALILFLNKWPTLGVYIAMLGKIIMRFVTVLIIGFLLIIAFGLAFYMTFYEPDLPVSSL